LISLILTIWFCLAVGFGLTGLFEQASAWAVALTVWSLTILLLVSCWKIPAIRQWAKDVALSRLIALHLSRFVGIYFLLLCWRGGLSCAFGTLAGWGDVSVAIGAVILLLWPRAAPKRLPLRLTLVWNILGLLDIVLVVITAFRVGLDDWQGMAALRILPLMLLPTFLVPLIIVSHILIFVRLTAR